VSDAPPRIRAFFALWPGERALAAVRKIAHEIADERHGRAPRDENIHVTLAFLGDVAGERLPELQAIGEEAAQASRAFDLTLDRIGGTAQGIAWLAPNAVPAELKMLREVLLEGLDRGAFPTERRAFRPHVTLARKCARPARRSAIVPVTWPAKRLSLVASTLGPGGSRYAELNAWPLGGSAGDLAQSTGIV
jgi:RNA 2',3'-cyclic 3'-phosphodiesterase